MHLVKYPECNCRFFNSVFQKSHDEEDDYVVEKNGELLSMAKSIVANWKRVPRETITDGEISQIAHSGKIDGALHGGMGVHLAVAYCLVFVFGNAGEKYCLNGTKNTIPGASF